MTHTPGPWTIIDEQYNLDEETGYAISTPHRGTYIAAHARNSMDYGAKAVCEWVHRDIDARLIAAAPELLEALTAMMNAFIVEHGDPHYKAKTNVFTVPEIRKAFNLARAAIDKATRS